MPVLVTLYSKSKGTDSSKYVFLHNGGKVLSFHVLVLDLLNKLASGKLVISSGTA